jgi:hypothetical protein
MPEVYRKFKNVLFTVCICEFQSYSFLKFKLIQNGLKIKIQYKYLKDYEQKILNPELRDLCGKGALCDVIFVCRSVHDCLIDCLLY